MDERVAIDFGGRREQEAGALGEGQAEHVVGPNRSHLDDLDWVGREVDGRGGRGQVEDVVDLPRNLDRVADVVLDELEPGVCPELGQPLGRRGDQVVEDEDLPAAVEQPLDHPATDETGAPGDHCARANRRPARVPTCRKALSAGAQIGVGFDPEMTPLCGHSSRSTS